MTDLPNAPSDEADDKTSVDATVLRADEYEPLGPDSLTWQIFGGTWHGMFIGLWSGSMQNMHPETRCRGLGTLRLLR